MSDVVHSVVEKDLCSSCGVCAGLCPTDALSMKIQRNGDLTPFVDDSRCHDNCQLCHDICPFAEGAHNPRRLNTELYSVQPNAKFLEDVGWYTHSIAGFRNDEKLRSTSASGGLLTWCLETLLKEGLVRRVAVIRLAKNRDKGFFEFYAASAVDELRESSGSIYHPVEISKIIREIGSNRQERWAIVGVPCLCAAVRNSQYLRKVVPFVFGLACGMYQNTFYTEMLLAESGIDRKNVTKIEYRIKSNDSPPSDYRFRGTDNLRQGKEIAYHGLPCYLGENAFFRLNACNFCMDVFAETADACFMDAWLPEYVSDRSGTSLVLIRNPAIQHIMEQGSHEQTVTLNEIEIQRVIASQMGHVRRKRYLIQMRQGKKMDPSTGQAFTIHDKLAWLVQHYVQQRSKLAWHATGRLKGCQSFWRAIWDVSVLINMEALFNKTLGRALCLMARLRR